MGYASRSGGARPVGTVRELSLAGAARREALVAYRTFTAADGREWQVWDVDPALGSGRLPGTLPGGWLCFESANEKRRLHPVPGAWDACTPTELEALRRLAAPVVRSARAAAAVAFGQTPAAP